MNRTPLSLRILLHVSLIALAASGAAWAVMKHLLPPVDEFSAAGHPLQPWAVALHVAAAPAALFAIGLIFRDHVRARWPLKGAPGRGSGVIVTLLVGPLAVTGIALQIVTHETARPLLGWAHLAGGAGFAALYGGHVVFSRRAVREARLRGMEQEPGVGIPPSRAGAAGTLR